MPFFVRWPERYKGGRKIDNTVCLTDVFETLADIVDLEKPMGSAEDSYSFLDLLRGNEDNYSRTAVIHHSSAGMFAIRKGDWKLILGNGSGGRAQPKGKAFQEPYQLFNMKDDAGETIDVIANYPKIAAELEKECLRIKGND